MLRTVTVSLYCGVEVWALWISHRSEWVDGYYCTCNNMYVLQIQYLQHQHCFFCDGDVEVIYPSSKKP